MLPSPELKCRFPVVATTTAGGSANLSFTAQEKDSSFVMADPGVHVKNTFRGRHQRGGRLPYSRSSDLV